MYTISVVRAMNTGAMIFSSHRSEVSTKLFHESAEIRVESAKEDSPQRSILEIPLRLLICNLAADLPVCFFGQRSVSFQHKLEQLFCFCSENESASVRSLKPLHDLWQ